MAPTLCPEMLLEEQCWLPAEVDGFPARALARAGSPRQARRTGVRLPAATFHISRTFLLLALGSGAGLWLSVPKARCMNLSAGH